MMAKRLLSTFSFRSFMASGLTFKSLIYFKLVSMQGVRQ